MKKKVYFTVAMLCVGLMFAGCRTEEPEEQPIAKFSYSVKDKIVTFTNESLHAKEYYWTFGDGSATSEMNPVKKYDKEGSYVVTLKAKNVTLSGTCEETIVVTEATPQANFSYTIDGLQVKFQNQSTNAQTFLWNFGNGKTSTEKNPTITYTSEGTYTVRLVAKNGSKENSVSKNVSVSHKQPTASFTYKTEHPLKVVLTNNSTNATSYKWEFGDGQTSTEMNPIHRYNSIGVYRIKLTATNGNKSNVYETNVEIKAPTTCTITGFTITKIPTNNKYYQVQLTDDYIMSKTTYFWTKWFILSSANLPYDYNLSTAKTLNIENVYIIRLYKYTGSGNPSETQASGKGDWTATITSANLKTYPETLTYSNTTAGIKVYFKWK